MVEFGLDKQTNFRNLAIVGSSPLGNGQTAPNGAGFTEEQTCRTRLGASSACSLSRRLAVPPVEQPPEARPSLPQGRNRNVNGAKEPQVVHDVYKIIRQLWLAVIAPGAVTLALLVRYEDWDAAYAHTSFDVFFWITVGILVLIGVAGNVLMFRSRGPMLLLENLGVLGALTILVSVATLVATFLFVVFAIASIFKKDNGRRH